jgi:hypothetical protein
MQVSINNTNQLHSLLNKYKRIDFVFEFPELSSAENELWLDKIKENYFACGCNTGKIFTMYALLLTMFVLVIIYFFEKNKFSIMLCLSSIVFIFLMGGLGKAAGKFIAYKNLKKDITKLNNCLMQSK